MPHITVKMFPGKTQDQKNLLTERILEAFKEVTGHSESALSVAIEEVTPELWMDTVYEKEIAPKMDQLYKKPGYGPNV